MLEMQDAGTRAADLANSPMYLRPDVKMEPLFCGWLAWPHLLSPVQAAMNVAFRYLPLLQSFVANPRLHIAATKDPRLFGGPFVHLSSADVPHVRELITTIQHRFSRMLRLADDFKRFDLELQESAKGFSLDDAYSRIPPSLAGMVELVYDLNNHPRISLIEELLYAEYGDDLRKDVQQISLCAVRESERDFFMSTPRLKTAGALTLCTEYSNPALDILTSMWQQPVSLRELEHRLGVADLAQNHGHLFTATPAPRDRPDYAGDGVRLRYFGHACVLIQTATTTLLIDPTFASEPAGADGLSACKRFTLGDLPDTIDYLILTHGHQDHFSPEMLLQIRSRVRKVLIPTNNRGSLVDPSLKLILAELGFFDVISLGYFSRVPFDEGELVSIPFAGEHADLEVYSKQSVFVRVKGRKLLFLADSDGRDAALYRRIAAQIGLGAEHGLDALFLGMECHGAPLTWLYGPLLNKPLSRRDDESRRLSGSNCERAVNIIRQFSCARVYVYAMGQEPWMRYVMGLEYEPDSVQLQESARLVEYCRSERMICERLYGSREILL